MIPTTPLVIVLLVVTFLSGCSSPGYVPNGLHLPASTGGYIDRDSGSEDTFIAEHWSRDAPNIKDDYALLRALERAYRAGYKYYGVQEHSTVEVRDQYLITYEPRYVIRGFKEKSEVTPNNVIIDKIREIEKRRGVSIPDLK